MVVDLLPEPSAVDISNARHSDFLVWKYGRSTAVSASDELDKYLRVEWETLPDLDVHSWWIQHQTQYPLLFKMAMDIMAIPAMASEVERVFSGYLWINRRC
jgi:hAT family C-terminal dimerisation region